MSEKMSSKNKKKMKQKSLRSKRGDSLAFSGRRQSIKMEEDDIDVDVDIDVDADADDDGDGDVKYIPLNPVITESRQIITQIYQDAIVPSPAPSSCTTVSPDSDCDVDLANHPSRGLYKKAQDEKRNTPLSPLDELSYGATPTPPFTTPTPPLSADRSRPSSPYRVDCFKPERNKNADLLKKVPPIAVIPDYAFRVSPTRRSPRLNLTKRSASPELWSPSKSPRKQSDDPFKVPPIPERPCSLDQPSTSGYVPHSSSGAKQDPSPSSSDSSTSTPTSSYDSSTPFYHTSSSDTSSVFGSGSGSGGSSISGSISIPSYNSSELSSPVEKPKDFDLSVDPFKVCTIRNFIHDEDYLEKLRQFLTYQLNYEKRSSDLFEYYQGNDDEFSQNHLIKCLEYTFIDKLLPFMSYVFGFPLRKDKLSIGASKYQFTNYLCCHDDVFDDKRIAFVLYLSKKWKKEYGGGLDFFRKNKYGDPTEACSSIVPEYNRFVFFEISNTTHHQVAEVVVPDHDRITINGWFHGIFPPPTIVRNPEPKVAEIRCTDVDDDHIFVENWIHKMYFSESRQLRIQARFKEDGFAFLPGFLRKKKLKEVIAALQESEGWMFIGPPNRRRYEVLPEFLLPKVVRDCLRVFISEAMFLTMFNMTGCKLHALALAAPEVEIELKFARYRMNEPDDDEELEQFATETLDIETAKKMGLPIAGNAVYGSIPSTSSSSSPSSSSNSSSPRRSMTPEKQSSAGKPSTSKIKSSPQKPSTSKIKSSPQKPSTSKITASPQKPSTSEIRISPEIPSTARLALPRKPTSKKSSSPKRTVTWEKPPTPEKPPHLKKLASPKKTGGSKKTASPKRTGTSKKPPTPEKPAHLKKSATPKKTKADSSPKPGTSSDPTVKKERSTTWLKDKRLDPRATIIIRRWKPGSYSLANDDDEVLAPQGVVDCHFTFGNLAGSCETHGGYISYVNKETGEEFYRCHPGHNVFHMVWLPPTEYRFIKYLNVLHKHVYYDINVIYKE